MSINRQNFFTAIALQATSQKGFDPQSAKKGAFDKVDKDSVLKLKVKDGDSAFRQNQLRKAFFPKSRMPDSGFHKTESSRISRSGEKPISGESRSDIARPRKSKANRRLQAENLDRPSNLRRIMAEGVKQTVNEKQLPFGAKISGGQRKIAVVETEDLSQEFQIREASYSCSTREDGGKTLYDADGNSLGSFKISQNLRDPNLIDIVISSSSSYSSTYSVNKVDSIESLEKAIPVFNNENTEITGDGLLINTSQNTYILISKESSSQRFSAQFVSKLPSSSLNCSVSPTYNFDGLLANTSSPITNLSTTPQFYTPKAFSTSSSTSVVVIPTTTRAKSSMFCTQSDAKISGMRSLSVYSSNSEQGTFIANLKYKIENNLFILQYSTNEDGTNPQNFRLDFSGNFTSQVNNIDGTPYSFEIKKIGSFFQIAFNEYGKESPTNCIIGQNFTTITTSPLFMAPPTTPLTTSTTPLTTSTTPLTTSTTPLTTSTTPFIANTSAPLQTSDSNFSNLTSYRVTTTVHNDIDVAPDLKSCRLENNSKFIISNSSGVKIQTIDLNNSSTEPKIRLFSTEFNPFNSSSLAGLKAQGAIANFIVEQNYSRITLNSGVILQSIKTADDVSYSVYDVANATRALGTCNASFNLTKSDPQPILSANYSCEKTTNGLQILKQNYRDSKFTSSQPIASLSFTNVSNNTQVNASLNNILIVFNRGNLVIKNSSNSHLYSFSSGGVLSFSKEDGGGLNRVFTNPYIFNVDGVSYKLNVSEVDIQAGKISYSLVDSDDNGFNFTRSFDNGETINVSSIIKGKVNSECSSSSYLPRSIPPSLPSEYFCSTLFESGGNKINIYSPSADLLGFYQISVKENKLKILEVINPNSRETDLDLLTFNGEQAVGRISHDSKMLSVVLQKKSGSNEFQLVVKNNQTLVGGCSIEKNATATPTICIKEPNGNLNISSVSGNYSLVFSSRKISDEGLPFKIYQRVNGSQQTLISHGSLKKGELNFSESLSLNATVDPETGLYKVEVLDFGKNISGACSFQEPELSPEYSCELVDHPTHSSNSSASNSSASNSSASNSSASNSSASNSSASNSSASLAWKKRFILSRSSFSKTHFYRQMPVSFNSSGIIEFEAGNDGAGNVSKIIFDISTSPNVVKLQSSGSTRNLTINETVVIEGINYTYRVDKNKNPYIESDEKLVIKPSVISLNASLPDVDKVYNISITQDSQIVGNCSYNENGKIITSIVGNNGVHTLPNSIISTTLSTTSSITLTTPSGTTTHPINNTLKLFEGLCKLAEGEADEYFHQQINRLAKNCSGLAKEEYNASKKSLSEDDVKNLCKDIGDYSRNMLINATNSTPPPSATSGKLYPLKQSIIDRLKCVQHSGDSKQKSIILAAVFGTILAVGILGAVYALRKRDKSAKTRREIRASFIRGLEHETRDEIRNAYPHADLVNIQEPSLQRSRGPLRPLEPIASDQPEGVARVGSLTESTPSHLPHRSHRADSILRTPGQVSADKDNPSQSRRNPRFLKPLETADSLTGESSLDRPRVSFAGGVGGGSRPDSVYSLHGGARRHHRP